MFIPALCFPAVGLSVPAVHLYKPAENPVPVLPKGQGGKGLDSVPPLTPGELVEKCCPVEECLDSYSIRRRREMMKGDKKEENSLGGTAVTCRP